MLRTFYIDTELAADKAVMWDGENVFKIIAMNIDEGTVGTITGDYDLEGGAYAELPDFVIDPDSTFLSPGIVHYRCVLEGFPNPAQARQIAKAFLEHGKDA